jgi:hypothetical protein
MPVILQKELKEPFTVLDSSEFLANNRCIVTVYKGMIQKRDAANRLLYSPTQKKILEFRLPDGPKKGLLGPCPLHVFRPGARFFGGVLLFPGAR